MRKNLYLLVAFLLIAVLFTGCSKPVKQTGTLFLTFSIPQGTSEYPALPPHADRALSHDGGQRPIPAGSTTLNVAVYNKTTNWSTKTAIPVDTGQTTATTQVTNIPVGSNYTVEVIPTDSAPTAIAMGRTDGIVVQSGISTSATLTVTKFQALKISCPATVEPLSPLAVSLSLCSPVSLDSADLANVRASFVDNVANPTISGSFDLFSATTQSLPAGSWVDWNIEDNVPDVVGTYYLLGVGMKYTQPVTNSLYSLFFLLDTPPAVVVETVETGAITIVVE